jgi:L-ascorbate metabolism protein UlaG (beta-lactamase superfamily)
MTQARITHIGGPTALIELEGWRILTDPTFDPPGRTYRFGIGISSRKLRGPALEPDEVGRVDAVLLSHDHHADNLDDAGRAMLPSADHVVTTVAGAGRLGGDTRGLERWDTLTLRHPGRPDIEITATPARHGPPGSRPIVGDATGFALQWEGQQHGVFWMTGDTVLYDGLRAVGDRLRIGTVLLHLGSVQFPLTGPLKYTMTAQDGVRLVQQLAPTTVVPVHYEGWSHFRQQRDGIDEVLATAPAEVRDRVRWAPIGQPLDITV